MSDELISTVYLLNSRINLLQDENFRLGDMNMRLRAELLVHRIKIPQELQTYKYVNHSDDEAIENFNRSDK